ncbi:DUF6090 family protein [Ichthyenterobacterium sp. W332]|uniref:DUF6090 family protein n=1 Tax=Microcosmobacter mediterraneus TaxID=3075607 RepID=A0ABU2YI43_9FLAO|nr:DUF6090 family protein [Ichthyenterobacterium sp. W332]MDT0557842.1 DUF6090 family protein [Ichthyenterobacterium sp. W332]
MIKFFRKIRYNLMETGKTKRYLKYAIGEITLVVIGILIALQINNWNEKIKHSEEEQIILKKLSTDIKNDIKFLKLQIENGKTHINDYKFCLDVLSAERDSNLEEFNQRFSSTMLMVSFDINKTTFNGITDSRTIDYIKNNELVDSLNTFYNNNYKGWDSANKDYTRNIIGPYLMKFNFLPIVNYDRFKYNTGGFSNSDFSQYNLSKFEVKPKTISDFKKDVFIINLLRQRLFLTEGQIFRYNSLKDNMERLLKLIQQEIKDD